MGLKFFKKLFHYLFEYKNMKIQCFAQVKETILLLQLLTKIIQRRETEYEMCCLRSNC